jgi:hypothetical protein
VGWTASLLPKVLERWEKPVQPELFGGRNAWLLFNAFTEVFKIRSPRHQMEDSLRLTRVFRVGNPSYSRSLLPQGP